MPTLIFSIEPDTRTDDGSGDIVLRTFANRSQVSELIRLVPDQDITLAPAFHNNSTFGNHRLTEGNEFDIVLNAAFTNISTFGPLTELTVAPPDAVILLDTFTNVSIFGAATALVVAPPDEVILLDTFNNVSTFGANTRLEIVLPDDGGEDHDAIIGYHPIGGVPS